MSDKVIALLDAASLPCVHSQRQAILDLEKQMIQEDQLEIPATHLVHGGMYARAVTVPAGTLLTGHIYKYDHIEVMASGTLVVTTDDGSSRVLTGYNLMPALSGKKRAAYAIEETTWITFHVAQNANHMSGDDIQDVLTADTFEDLEDFYNEVNRVDYLIFLQQLGWTQEQMDKIVTNKDDYLEIELHQYGLKMGDSPIHGQGVFATEPFDKGVPLSCSRVGGFRTQLGRYVNHAVRPNCTFEVRESDVLCVTCKDIAAGDELTVNYRELMADRPEAGNI